MGAGLATVGAPCAAAMKNDLAQFCERASQLGGLYGR